MANYYGSRNRGTGRSTGTTASSRGNWGKTGSYGSFSYSGGRQQTTGRGTTGSGYNQLGTSFACKAQSYRTLWQQTKAGANRPSPTTLKTFDNWVNKGAVVFCITNSQINRCCGTNQSYKSNAAVKSALCKCFGKSTIKAVCSAKGGGYMVAANPTWKGNPFKFPS